MRPVHVIPAKAGIRVASAPLALRPDSRVGGDDGLKR